MATIIEAAKWMNEGKSVRRPNWKNPYFFFRRGMHYGGSPIVTGPRDNPETELDTEDLLATDWVVVE